MIIPAECRQKSVFADERANDVIKGVCIGRRSLGFVCSMRGLVTHYNHKCSNVNNKRNKS